MKIALPLANKMLCAHFGHCQEFCFVQTDGKTIINTSYHTPPPHEPGVLPQWLEQQKIEVVLAGGMGIRAQKMLENKNITVITGVDCSLSVENAVTQYLAGELKTGENACSH